MANKYIANSLSRTSKQESFILKIEKNIIKSRSLDNRGSRGQLVRSGSLVM